MIKAKKIQKERHCFLIKTENNKKRDDIGFLFNILFEGSNLLRSDPTGRTRERGSVADGNKA